MFRISKTIELAKKGRVAPKIDMKIAIWNLTLRCNLRCDHCYSSAVINAEDYWSLARIQKTIDELVANGFKFVILSGGEPLLRTDIFEIARMMQRAGINTYLSTNGTTIDEKNIDQVAKEFDYVGISIDGDEATHDKFRGKKGSFRRSLSAMLALNAMGKKTGLRFTITGSTYGSLPFIFDLVKTHKIPKLYLSNLVYAGYGLEQLNNDITKNQKIEVISHLIDQILIKENSEFPEVVTGNSEMDAVYLYQFVKTHKPEIADQLYTTLTNWAGNSAGVKLVNITPNGDVKPDPFFPKPIGNAFETSFGEIWNAQSEDLSLLREYPRKLEGKCAECKYIAICNGGSRARAYSVYGSLRASDPACYVDHLKEEL